MEKNLTRLPFFEQNYDFRCWISFERDDEIALF